MPSTHFEATVSATRLIVDEPMLARCTLGHWPIAAALLATIAVALVVLEPVRWHLVAGGAITLGVGVMTLGVSRILVARPNGSDSSVLAVVTGIEFPYEEIYATNTLAMIALSLVVMALAVKKDLRLRIAACVVMPLSIALLVRSAMCAHDVRVAIAALDDVGDAPLIDAAHWPTGVHMGETFAVETKLWPVVTHRGIFGIGGRTIDEREWSTLQAYTPHDAGVVKVTLTATRGPVRVEYDKELTVYRDEGPSWMPLALGNTWTLIEAEGKPERIGAIEEIFTKNTPSPKAGKKILRVDREVHEHALHTFVLKLTDVDGQTHEEMVYRRDGELVDESGATISAGHFPLLGSCRYATAPVDAVRALAGPTICGATTKDVPYGEPHGVGLALAIISLGAIDSRPTHRVEEGFVLARAGVE